MRKSFPTNIKQIGSISDDMRIYIEDYAFTFIKQISEEDTESEKIATLVGYEQNIDDKKVIFIVGVIKGKYSKNENGLEVFTKYSQHYIEQTMEQYFDDLKIMGWVYIQPSFGDYLNEKQIEYHLKNYPVNSQVLFIVDPIENVNCFYIQNEDGTGLKNLKGYFVYFDKNEQMHEYMLNLNSDKKTEGFLDEITDKITEKIRPKESDGKRVKKLKMKKIQFNDKLNKALGSLCAVLFIVIFAMGSTIAKNENEISMMNSKINTLTENYNTLITRFDNAQTTPVFANSVETTTIEQTTVTQTTVAQTEATTEATTKEKIAYYEYTVQKGDSLGVICQKHYGDKSMMARVMEENNLEDSDKIYYGKVLLLPEK